MVGASGFRQMHPVVVRVIRSVVRPTLQIVRSVYWRHLEPQGIRAGWSDGEP